MIIWAPYETAIEISERSTKPIDVHKKQHRRKEETCEKGKRMPREDQSTPKERNASKNPHKEKQTHGERNATGP